MSAFAPNCTFAEYASPGVLQGADGQTPIEYGPRRGPSVQTLIPIRDRAVHGRLAIDARELDRS